MISKRALVTSILALVTQQAIAQQDWTAFDLGSLGGSFIQPMGMNSGGQIVGLAGFGPILRAFVTDANGRNIRILDTPTTADVSNANSINDAGEIVGDYRDANGKIVAFRTGSSGRGLVTLDSFGGTITDATAINNIGQVAGYAFSSGGNIFPFITSSTGSQIFPLMPITGGKDGGTAEGINVLGQVVGTLYLPFPTYHYHAFAIGANGSSMVDLGSIGGFSSYGVDINDRSQIIGQYEIDSSGTRRSFITGENWTDISDIGALAGGDTRVEAINDFGQVVGESRVSGVYHAFFSQKGDPTLIDLNSAVQIGGGVFLDMAFDINNSGQIVARGSNGHSYLLTPSAVPEPTVWILFLVGMLFIIAVVSRSNCSPTGRYPSREA